jgi:hypothetical protein
MKPIAAVALVAACACTEKPLSSPVAVTSVPAPVEPAPQPKAERHERDPLDVHVPESGTALDDLPHRREQLKWLARVGDCLPQDRELPIVLDVYDKRLVACVAVFTRRDVTVQLDPVHYACWNVDPSTGNVTKRSDLGRDYFACRDGSCPPGFPTKRWVSHDGTQEIRAGVDELAIVSRPGGAPVRTIKLGYDAEGAMRDSFTLVGRSLIQLEGSVYIRDDRGALRGEVPGIGVHVVDEDHVLVQSLDGDHVLYQLSTNKRTTVIRGADYLEKMVRFGGTFYAVDSDPRRLVVLDPRTLQPQRTLPLRTCPLPV